MFYNLYLYQNAFKYIEMGYASALAWVLFIIVLALTLLVFRSSPMWVFYEGEVEAMRDKGQGARGEGRIATGRYVAGSV